MNEKLIEPTSDQVKEFEKHLNQAIKKSKLNNVIANVTLQERIEEINEKIALLKLEVKELTDIANKPPKDNFPKTWESLKYVNGYYIDEYCKPQFTNKSETSEVNKNVTPTEKELNSFIAACQLRQLAKVINDNQTEDEWVSWSTTTETIKYYPYFDYMDNELEIKDTFTCSYNSIYFKRLGDLERSLIEQKELWLTYFKVK